MEDFNDHSERAHSKLGASGTKQWLGCPGSVRMNEDIPSRTSSFAEEGTQAHELLETCLIKGIDANELDDADLKGKVIPEDMLPAVQEALDHVRSYITDETDLGVEQRFSLEWLYPGMFGTNDVKISEDFGDLHIMDYKHGAGIAVDVENNYQLLFYAIGAAYDTDLEDFEDYERVFLHIIQPRAYHVDGSIRIWETTVEYLREFAEVLRKGAIATTKKDAPLNPGEEQCRWCDAKSLCPAIMKKSQAVAKSDFQVVEKLSAEHLTLKEVSKVVENAKMLTDFIEACKKRSMEALMNGADVPGLKLVRKRGSRKWNQEDDQMEVKILEEFSDLKMDDILNIKLKTAPQIETLVGKKKFKDLKDYVELNEGGLDVAPLSDKRKPAKMDAKLDFDNVN